MTFYVASGVANCSRVNEAAAALAANGHYRTYDWTTHGSVKDAPDAFKRRVAASEAGGVAGAELVVLLLPGGKGTHTELGLAIASAGRRRIIVWSEDPAPFDGSGEFCVFYHHPRVERVVCPFQELMSLLSAI